MVLAASMLAVSVWIGPLLVPSVLSISALAASTLPVSVCTGSLLAAFVLSGSKMREILSRALSNEAEEQVLLSAILKVCYI